jgi:hypothetical protein
MKITELIKEGVSDDHAIMVISQQLAKKLVRNHDELIQKVITNDRAHLGKVRDFVTLETEDPNILNLIDLDVWLDEEERGGSSGMYVRGKYGARPGSKLPFKPERDQESGDISLQPNMLYSFDECYLVLSHELRHALDDIKSKGKALSRKGTRNEKNAYHGKRANPEDSWSTPAELNAILSSVMSAIKINIEDNYDPEYGLDNNDLLEIINHALDVKGQRILMYVRNEKSKRVMSRLYQYAAHVLQGLKNANR